MGSLAARVVKYLLLLLVCFLAYAFIKTKSRKIVKRPSDGARSAPAVEDMARCAHCGVHFPLSEGFRSTGRIFCSSEHLKERDKTHS